MQDDGDGDPVVGEVLRTGWKLKGRVLRPAMVKVTRGRPDGAPTRVVREGLLRRARRAVERVRQGHLARLQEAGQAVPPGREPGEHGSRGALQGDLRRVRRARRQGEAQGVRRGPAHGRVGRRPRRCRWVRRVRSRRRRTYVHVRRRRRRVRRHLRQPLRRRWRRGAAGGAASGPQRGPDLETELHLAFDDAVTRRHVTRSVPRRRDVLDVRRFGRGAGHDARDVSAVPRQRFDRGRPGSRSRSRRCAPRAAGRGAGHPDPVPDVSRAAASRCAPAR